MNLMKILEASEYLNLKESRLRHMVFMKQIPFIKIGASVMFNKADLDTWLNGKRQAVLNG